MLYDCLHNMRGHKGLQEHTRLSTRMPMPSPCLCVIPCGYLSLSLYIYIYVYTYIYIYIYMEGERERERDIVHAYHYACTNKRSTYMVHTCYCMRKYSIKRSSMLAVVKEPE